MGANIKNFNSTQRGKFFFKVYKKNGGNCLINSRKGAKAQSFFFAPLNY